MSVYPAIFLSSYLSVYLQAWKQSYFARLSHVLNLIMSKTKPFCKTYSIFEVGNIQKRSNSARLPSKMESWVQSWRPCTNAFCDCTAPATKKWCQVIRSAAPVTQNHLIKPTDLMLQNATPLRKSALWPPNISDEHVSCTAPATRNASLQILCECPTPAIVFGNATNPHVLLTFDRVSLEKNTVFRDFATFSRTCIFCLLTLSLPCLRSSCLLFSDSSHLGFSFVHIVGSLASKLPSMNMLYLYRGRKSVLFHISTLHPGRNSRFITHRDVAKR